MDEAHGVLALRDNGRDGGHDPAGKVADTLAVGAGIGLHIAAAPCAKGFVVFQIPFVGAHLEVAEIELTQAVHHGVGHIAVQNPQCLPGAAEGRGVVVIGSGIGMCRGEAAQRLLALGEQGNIRRSVIQAACVALGNAVTDQCQFHGGDLPG